MMLAAVVAVVVFVVVVFVVLLLLEAQAGEQVSQLEWSRIPTTFMSAAPTTFSLAPIPTPKPKHMARAHGKLVHNLTKGHTSAATTLIASQSNRGRIFAKKIGL